MKAKTKLTKVWSILIVLVMVVGMLPTVALAAGAATADLTSGDGSAALALLNAAKTEGVADSVWDSNTNTLTLNGVNFETTAATAVKLPAGAKIVLNGVNTITGGNLGSGDCYGIYAEGSLTISGSGTLNVTGGDAATRSCGIYTDNALTISSGPVTATSGDVSGGASLGIYSIGNFTISGTADVTGKGGTATNDGSFGINAEGEVIISGGKVEAIGGAGKGSDGLYSGNGQINISGGKVEAFGGDAPSAGGSVGIFAQTSSANVQISGTADVTAIGGESASDRSYGIYSRNPVTISGGKVEAFGGEGSYPGYGINNANISGGTVTAASEYGDAINNVTTGSAFKTISFDRNGGSGEMIAYTNADSYILPANGFTAPADKEFMGWSESSTGDVIEDTTVNATDGKTLYAIWKINVSDFDDDPTAALALLNATKTGTADSEWNSSTKTLTLNGVNFETTVATAVRLPADSTIILNGVNTIKGGNSDSDECFGIEGFGNLTIKGTGTLNVTGGATTGYYSSFGIYASRDLTIKSGTVIATGGTVSQDYNSHGIFVYSGYVTIESGTVIATGGTAGEGSFGINSDYVNIKGGKVEATGGTAGVHSYGIYLYENITIEGGTVIAKANTEVMNKAPSALPTAYQWRTSESGAYNKYPDSAYSWNAAHTYLEIKEPEYTVTFDANGGTGTMADVTDVLGDYTLPENGFTAPEGKQFKGWSVDGSEKAVGDKITVTANTTVKAVWENITYTVSFDSNGGTGTMTAQTGVLGDYTLPANGFTAPEGKQFKCWSVDGNEKAVGDKITVTANITVTAVWEDIEYTVTVTNGTASPSQAAEGATVTLTANAASTGQVFDKWVVESGNVTLADATSAITTFTMPAGDVSVKATYHTHSYGSEWETDASKHWHECSCGDKSAEAVHTAGDWITDTAATATTDGTKHKECTDCGYVMETGTIPATGYTVSFHANGGTGTMADVTGVLGDYTLPANGFTAPEGKQFKCWSVDGNEKAVGDKITVTANITVTAVWENIPAGHTCDIKPVAKVNPSCTEGGKEAYYKCEGCGKFFEDALGAKEITDLAAWGNIPKNGHTASDWKSDDADHWKECTVVGCGVIIEDSKEAHTASDWITDTAATATTAGTKHKACTACGYVMETGTIPATGSVTAPKIIKGDGAKVTRGEKTALSFRSDADFSDFIRVEIDGKTLDAKNYTVKEESTIVTLNADYVSTLSVGTHTIGVVSNNGTATATFTVEAKQTTGDKDNPNTGAQDDVPQTGDNSMMALWIAVLFVFGFGVVATAVYGKKRKSVK